MLIFGILYFIIHTLGQLIGGIAHNLKTPLMSIGGNTEELIQLTNEYYNSIGDPGVTDEDHIEVAKEMLYWLNQIKPQCIFMSNVISTVKGQAAQLNSSGQGKFTLEELIKSVDILMRYTLKMENCKLNISIEADTSTVIDGDINNLTQVINNLILNSIESYDQKMGDIDLKVYKQESDLIFTVRDYGKGISEDVQKVLFKEMITTKGSKGTGLGLFMSYSSVRGQFNGDMCFESKDGGGTTFYIKIPTI